MPLFILHTENDKYYILADDKEQAARRWQKVYSSEVMVDCFKVADNSRVLVVGDTPGDPARGLQHAINRHPVYGPGTNDYGRDLQQVVDQHRLVGPGTDDYGRDNQGTEEALCSKIKEAFEEWQSRRMAPKTVNHEEAIQLAHLRPQSNLARCYIDAWEDISRLRAALKWIAENGDDGAWELRCRAGNELRPPTPTSPINWGGNGILDCPEIT